MISFDDVIRADRQTAECEKRGEQFAVGKAKLTISHSLDDQNASESGT